MHHRIATALSIVLVFYDGIQSFIYREVNGISYDFSGRSASIYGFTLVVLAVAWFICWYTSEVNFIKDDSWPYLLISTYFVAFFVKMVS